MPLPSWWGELPTDRPVVYVNTGSSGSPALLSAILAGLSDLPVFIVAATAGRPRPEVVPANARVAHYLPGDAAAQAASVMICNGGSPATQQALRAGTPMLALPGNMDQYLNMAHVRRTGAALMLRAEQADAAAVRAAVRRLLDDQGYADAALRLAPDCAPERATRRFAELLEQLDPAGIGQC